MSPAMEVERLLDSESMGQLLHADQSQWPITVDDIDVEIEVTWPEIGRASRVLERLDRELRRCARAWQDAYTLADSREDGRLFTSPDHFVKRLRDCPDPGGTHLGHLAMTGALAEPLRLRTEPRGTVFALLAAWPLTALGFAMSRFGVPVEMSRTEYQPPLDPDRQLDLDAYAGAFRTWRIQGVPMSVFRTVARHRDERGSFGELTVHITRMTGSRTSDKITGAFRMPG